jgi:uncharacterized repeat protein (TIGR03803 family)
VIRFRAGGEELLMSGRASYDTFFKLTCAAISCVAAVLGFPGVASAQLRFDLLHSFSASPSNGSNSSAPLIQGKDGHFYGTTYNGGSNAKGTVFRITATGTFTLLHSFIGPDGDTPYSPLLQANDGNFYGTTYFGGTLNLGTVYRISPDGAFAVLHSFAGVAYGDGARPYYAALIQGSDGNLYGTTYNGGISSSGNAQGRGTVFRMTLDGATTILHAFTGGAGIAFPYSGLIQANDGHLYGTAYAGDLAGNGGIFRINIMTMPPTFTALHTFRARSSPHSGARRKLLRHDQDRRRWIRHRLQDDPLWNADDAAFVQWIRWRESVRRSRSDA